MKLELKNIKHSEWASEETHCYQASLYVDGKPFAIVSNDGQGGSDRDYPHPKFKGDYRAQMRDVSRYFSGLRRTAVTEWFPEGMEQCLEYWCAEQIDDWLSARDLKKHLKKSYVYHFADGAGMFAHKLRPASTVAVVLNDLPFDEALSIWKETANA
jgi:hypothetical protein